MFTNNKMSSQSRFVGRQSPDSEIVNGDYSVDRIESLLNNSEANITRNAWN